MKQSSELVGARSPRPIIGRGNPAPTNHQSAVFNDAKGLFAFLVLAFCFSAPLWAVEIPPEFGRVSENLAGTNGKTIILIQEAHVDYGAQKAMVEILKKLIQKDSLRLVLVEGGWENMGLSYMRNYGSPKGREEVAERYLREGKISAEEYLDIVSDFDFEIWGVENPEYYAENMRAFLKISAHEEAFMAALNQFESGLNERKEKIYPPELFELEKKKAWLEEKKISLLEYLHFFVSLRGSNPSEADRFPHLHHLLSLSGLEGEKGVDPEKAEWEKQNLIRALTNKLTRPELDKLKLLESRKTPEEELEFLKSLLEFREVYKRTIGPTRVEYLKGYLKALQEMSRVNPRALFEELGKLETTVFESRLNSPEAKELYQISRSFGLLKKLFELKLSPEEFEIFEKRPEEFKPTNWERRLGLPLTPTLSPKGRGKEWGLSPSPPEGVRVRGVLQEIEWSIPAAKAFYLSAKNREEAIIKNTAAKFEKTKESMAAMIVGGFHAEKIARDLQARGYSVWVVSPRFTPADLKTQQKHYFEVLKTKWGSGPIAAVTPKPKS